MDFGLLYENDKGEYVVLNDVRMADIRLASLVYLLCLPYAVFRLELLKFGLPCEQAWLRSVTKVWMTDTSACGRIEFHILWCRDCVSLIRSRFRDQVFDQVSTFRFGLRRSYVKKQRHNHYECDQAQR